MVWGSAKQELEDGGGKRNLVVQGGWIDSGAESKIVDIGGLGKEVSGDWGKNGSFMAITEAETDKVINMKECGTDEKANKLGFQGRILSTARNVGECCDQFSGTVERGVREEKVSEVVITMGFQIGSIVNRRGCGHKQLDCIRRTTKQKHDELSACGGHDGSDVPLKNLEHI